MLVTASKQILENQVFSITVWISGYVECCGAAHGGLCVVGALPDVWCTLCTCLVQRGHVRKPWDSQPWRLDEGSFFQKLGAFRSSQACLATSPVEAGDIWWAPGGSTTRCMFLGLIFRVYLVFRMNQTESTYMHMICKFGKVLDSFSAYMSSFLWGILGVWFSRESML